MGVEGRFCSGCPQQPIGVRRVETDGLGTNGVLIAGESPYTEEVAKGIPFAGPSGSLLNRAFDLLGVNRQDFLICNSVIWCKPPHLGWLDKPGRYPDVAIAIEHCKPYFDELVDRMRPKVIVTLGNTSLSRVCGVSGLDQRHSYLHDSPYGIPVIPTFHPSFILQGNQKYMSVLLFALRRALDVAAGAFKPTEYELLLDPDIKVATEYLSAASQAQEVICDIETPTSSLLADEEEAEEDPTFTIVRISFSIPQPVAVEGLRSQLPSEEGLTRTQVAAAAQGEERPLVAGTQPAYIRGPDSPSERDSGGATSSPKRLPRVAGPAAVPATPSDTDRGYHRPISAITFPWTPPYIAPALSALQRAKSLVFWNASFDLPRLHNAGATTSGTVVDAMWAWHFLQSDLPKSLGFVAPFYYAGPAWKHLASGQPPFYSATDSAVTRSCYLGIRADLIQQQRWDAFTRHCTQITPILGSMGSKGIRVDETQQAAFMTRMQSEYDAANAELQAAVPVALKPVKRWKRAPRDMSGVREL
jgi:uracil-DNA glycosylase family 4